MMCGMKRAKTVKMWSALAVDRLMSEINEVLTAVKPDIFS